MAIGIQLDNILPWSRWIIPERNICSVASQSSGSIHKSRWCFVCKVSIYRVIAMVGTSDMCMHFVSITFYTHIWQILSEPCVQCYIRRVLLTIKILDRIFFFDFFILHKVHIYTLNKKTNSLSSHSQRIINIHTLTSHTPAPLYMLLIIPSTSTFEAIQCE